ncbi:related to ribosomal protein L5 precursor,mitochondrial [Claviceps purpurea 20.1]|uniref:Related to ribosomal protein L5,mitochondrial n=1 Tax=Claviceps purpurea (strain 20.1) TaxID=1111077 RepID=M1WDH8_CLAP2|nr:hypothetical protein E4U38_005953 [Claviceps purpurea]CCE34810.1 related to ribosomal protein L5 precursor,mitochondrial [Claviceps purpurea 20.1]KAG6155054.1 hypothetical protein E4U37_001517 [Claviceps purpurea]KAG6187410.1 hypothetical protein E4U36_008062 [Claviceps purpurea]KAG6199874.1 hypothetical protein E4U50_007265 [Claviceps purpurea]
MSSLRESARLARLFGQRRLPLKAPQSCARRFASTAAGNSQTLKADQLADLESTTTYTSAAPEQESIDKFKTGTHRTNEDRLPGGRYQYHPPKYYRGPLHPVQSPESSDPTARDFVPGPFSVPRLKQTYDSTIAHDLMTMTYKHKPPGYVAPESKKGHLREWDDSSPYHKNRPRRGPRGGASSRLGLLERDVEWNNITSLSAVTINSYAPEACHSKDYLHVTRAVIQAISGAYPEVTTIKHQVSQWRIREGDKAGCKVTLHGSAALEFVDKLVTLVLPKIKDWPGIKASTGDDSGNLAFGMKPEWVTYFPEIEFNFDMYPPRLIPGCDIFLHTTGTSDRQGRLLLQALGFPFYGKKSR